jgi:Uma2 family endonuclease
MGMIMATARRTTHIEWTAEAFLATDQAMFGDAWRYELIVGQIVAHAAPSPEHGAIVANLARALGNRLSGHPNGCRTEVGAGAAPKRQQRKTARIPDVAIRCGQHMRVVFEVISPSELRKWRQRDQKRRDLQDVEGVTEIVEIYQNDHAVHAYRRAADGTWPFESIGGEDAVLNLPSVGIEVPLAEIYEGVAFDPEDESE